MLKFKHSLGCLGTGLALALLNATISPASAQQVFVIDGNNSFGYSQTTSDGYFTYGNPLNNRIPVHPRTINVHPRTINVQPRSIGNYHPYPPVRHQVINDTTLFNPTLVNPIINNSTLINPVIINNSWQRTPIRRSRVIIYPGWKR
ncbi:hypothetical protein [Nostoc sp. CMAA1605]|uniref:hypothetical protein n=1 Tax=Nostoc sp. CMAA1605 TaxID=2055159 RepID=UPI001F171D82|nr:hypothetical protein [Nostoc sp. CMAA1605]MCF4969415.1 hypothetical protein [Nostoc sp. CMAA1605]